MRGRNWFSARETVVFALWLHIVSVLWTAASIGVVAAISLLRTTPPRLSAVDYVGFVLLLASAAFLIAAALRVARRHQHAWGFTMAAEAAVVPVSVIAWMLLNKVSGSADVYEIAAVTGGLAVLIMLGLSRRDIRNGLLRPAPAPPPAPAPAGGRVVTGPFAH